MLFKLAWKNIWRNRHRTVITMASIFFAVILSVITGSLQDGIFSNLIKNIVSFYTGYIQVHKQGYWNEQILDNSFETTRRIESDLLRHPRVQGYTSRIESFALASSGSITKGCKVTGIIPEKEDQVTKLKNKLVSGKYLHLADNSVLLSEGLAERLKIATSDTVILIGQGYHGATAAGKYTVKGILQFASPELNNNMLFMPLQAAQDFYGAYNMITSYVLLVQPDALAETSLALKPVFGSGMEVMTWEEMLPDIKQHIKTDSNNMKVIQGILYLLICFGIFSTLLMMMMERKYEMGMLVAIGMKKFKLMYLLLTELVITVLSGCLLGVISSIPLVYYLNRYPIRIGGETAEVYKRFGFEPVFPASISAEHFINQGLTVLIIGILLSVYPLYKIGRLNVVASMKK